MDGKREKETCTAMQRQTANVNTPSFSLLLPCISPFTEKQGASCIPWHRSRVRTSISWLRFKFKFSGAHHLIPIDTECTPCFWVGLMLGRVHISTSLNLTSIRSSQLLMLDQAISPHGRSPQKPHTATSTVNGPSSTLASRTLRSRHFFPH